MIIDIESINEVFGLSKKEKEEKKDLEFTEFGYDKKYNAFCLSVSNYSVDRLEDMLKRKENELSNAKSEKKNAKDRFERKKIQAKINYLENVCTKCRLMIKRKK